jgi:prepilin-type N-terminal cleavage/methylation domain-containing protein
MCRRTGNPQSGFSLLELVLVVAILVLLIGLLLPAIQKVRSAAVKVQGQNNLRQLVIGTHHYASANEDRLPYWPYRSAPIDSNPMVMVLRFVGKYQTYEDDREQWFKYVGAVFQNPADPTYQEPPPLLGDTSYVASAMVFRKGAHITASCPDGTSSTIGWTEQYAHCGASGFRSNESAPPLIYYVKGLPFYDLVRRASFADAECGDIYPRTVNGTAVAAHPHWAPPRNLFQVMPRPADCYPDVPTASHPSGLAVGMMDGSLRTISPSVSPSVFWALVTPNGGEVVSDW